MKELSLFRDINSRRLDGGRFELTVKINENSVPASLNDVGFGISQFLPVIVADLQLGSGSTLFVTQPEFHLHPSVQAEFGNYMVKRIKNSDKNYVIETHSEYLLNRIRLAIVKGEIPKEDVSIYYFQNNGEETSTHQLEFTRDGQILNAPEDFFKTYMIDVMDIAVHANSDAE
jgi:predicted ATPase